MTEQLPELTIGPVPLELAQPLDMLDARAAYWTLAQQRRRGRDQLEQATRGLAEAEKTYRKARAQAYVTVQAPAAGQRDREVDAETAELREIRDIKKGLVDAARERLAEVDGERASLHRLVEWSQRLDPTLSDHNTLRRVA